MSLLTMHDINCIYL